MFRRIFFKDERVRPVFRVLIYIVAVLVAQVLLWFPIGIVDGVMHGHAAVLRTPPVWLTELGSALAVVGSAFLLRRYLDRRSIGSLGLSLQTKWGRFFAIGVLLGGGMQLFAFAVEFALGRVHGVGFAPLAADVRVLLAWGGIFLVAALAEEMLLRGYILQNLWEEIGFWPAAILTSGVFALLHFHNPHFGEHPWIAATNIAVDGIWSCLAILWTRSLWLAWGAHFGWNLFEGSVLGLPVSGIDTGGSVINELVTGPTLMSGGTFGPEAGFIGLIALLAGLAVLYALHRFGAFDRLPDTREAYAGGPAPTPARAVH